MKIDRKSKGSWLIFGTKRIDNIAYHLYVYNNYTNITKIRQVDFMRRFYENGRFNFYYEAAMIEIRKEKIEKLKKYIKKNK